jgi:hypothetical protein
VSRHHILPPFIYMPPPPKPKETRRKRGVHGAASAGEVDEIEEAGDKSCAHPSPSSLASTPRTARAQPFNLRSRVAALMFGLNLRSSRQLSAKCAGSG